MALRNKTHTLIFYKLIEAGDPVTGIAGVPFVGSGIEVRGQLTPMSADAAYNATGAELKNPYLFMADLDGADAAKFGGYAVDEEGVTYTVQGEPKRWNVIPAQSFSEIYLEQNEVNP